MRIWSLHPKYPDARGLVGLWSEALLAQAVPRGDTIGYVNHPQLLRFRRQPSPLGCIVKYLRDVYAESERRGYRFSFDRIGRDANSSLIDVTLGQIQTEWEHLMAKLKARDPKWHARLNGVRRPQPHPLFRIVPGDPETWDKSGVRFDQDLKAALLK